MKFEELKNRDDLKVDLGKLQEKVYAYFDGITREELISDLEEIGCIVEKEREIKGGIK